MTRLLNYNSIISVHGNRHVKTIETRKSAIIFMFRTSRTQSLDSLAHCRHYLPAQCTGHTWCTMTPLFLKLFLFVNVSQRVFWFFLRRWGYWDQRQQLTSPMSIRLLQLLLSRNVREVEEREGLHALCSLGNGRQRWLIRQTHHLCVCAGTLPTEQSRKATPTCSHLHTCNRVHWKNRAAQVAPGMKCTVDIKRTPLTSPIARKWWCTEIFCHYKGRTKELTWKRSQ